jgi:alanine racemase
VAQSVGTISYEILAGLGKRLPRIERTDDTKAEK